MLSFMAGGFAIGASKAEPSEVPSLSDMTPKQQSRFCSSDRSSTEGLYEFISAGHTLVFKGADVLTMRDPELLRSHDVIVRDRRIIGLQPSGGELPSDAILVAAKGKTLIPGLSDIHAHLFLAFWGQGYAPMLGNSNDGSEYILPYDLQLFQLLAAGITRTEIMAGCVDALWIRDSINSGKLVGPRMRVASPLVDGAPTYHSPLMSYVVGDLDGGRRAVDQAVDLGFDFIKTYSRLPADGFEGVMQRCDAHGIRVMGHIPSAVDVEDALARGQGGVAHASELFYNLGGPERVDFGRIERIARKMAAAGTWMHATLVVADRSEWLIGTRALHAPDIEMMNPLQRSLFREGSDFVTGIRQREDLKVMMDNVYELSVAVTRAVHQAGGLVLTGTDHPNPYIIDGFSLHEELERLVGDAGMSQFDTLYASTHRAAEYHGEKDGGFIAEGADADLVLLDANPLRDITATRKIDTVLRGNVLLRQDKIREGLTRVQKAFAAMPAVEVNLAAGSEYMTKTEE